jgi:hypothetical protein
MDDCNRREVFVGSRRVGAVVGKVFRKQIKFSKHALRTPPALALSNSSLAQAERLGATSIEITDTENGIAYRADIVHFRRFAFDLQRGGFEPQKALVLDRWSVTGGNPPGNHRMRIDVGERVPMKRTVHEAEPIQLSLV